jgi:putative tricarboxylic transport membrane protein
MTNDRQKPNADGSGERPGGRSLPHRLRWDYVVGVAIVLFCAVVFAITTTFDEVPRVLSHGVPPERFPRLVLGIMVVLTVLMIYQASRRKPKNRKPVPPMVYLSAGLLVLFVVAISIIGTIGAMVVFCVALAYLWGERRYWVLGIFALVFPAAVYVLFSRLLEVRFPAGLLRSMLG